MSGSGVGGALWMIAVGLTFSGVGLVFASDYRGLTTDHVEEAIERTHWLTRVPPWSSLPAHLKDPYAGQTRQYWLERAIGAVFAAAGAIIFIVGIVDLWRAAL